MRKTPRKGREKKILTSRAIVLEQRGTFLYALIEMVHQLDNQFI